MKYALSEFLENEEIFKKIGGFGNEILIKNWTLEKIVKLRKEYMWRKYIELIEYITQRSFYWEIDFSNVEKAVGFFAESIKPFKILEENTTEINLKNNAAYTFRICVGSQVLDVIATTDVKKLKNIVVC